MQKINRNSKINYMINDIAKNPKILKIDLVNRRKAIINYSGSLFMIKVVLLHGSSSLLVIQTHQESVQNTFIRSSSDFLMRVYSSAIPGSPNVRKTPLHMIKNNAAADIVRDFQEDPHLRLWYVHYGASISAWTSGDYPNPVESQSSATWGDISGCTGGCTPEQVGLWVYVTPDDATAAYMDIINTTPVKR